MLLSVTLLQSREPRKPYQCIHHILFGLRWTSSECKIPVSYSEFVAHMKVLLVSLPMLELVMPLKEQGEGEQWLRAF
jgi:hypothetical protein